MLHLSSDLSCVTIENVAPADQSFAIDERSFLAADVTEYRGGRDAASAHTITLVQVKYSPLRPEQVWTLTRLVRNERSGGREKPRTSILRKLADMLRPYTRLRANRPQLVVRLLTNQPISEELREDLTNLKTVLGDSTAIRVALERASRRARKVAQEMKRAVELSWTDLADLIRYWDLATFGQPSLFTREAELFRDLRGAFPDASIRLEALMGELQSASTPRRSVQLDRKMMLAALRLSQEELFPAPALCGDGSDLFATAASEKVLSEVNAGDGFVAVHGRAGIGKTSALLVALRRQGAGVLYDCYARGRGLRPGEERFGYPVCFVQIINELDARFQTGLLATTGLDYRALLLRFREALRAAAERALQQGKRLVIAFDAVDNALEQQRRTLGETHASFVEMLWQIEWPSNCAVVVSFRTENERDVGAPAGVTRVLELGGFTQAEMEELAAVHGASISPEDLRFLWERTHGNPRVASKVLDEISTQAVANARGLIDATARSDAFAYYDQEQGPGRRLSDLTAQFLLALLYEIRQPPSVATLGKVVGESIENVRQRLSRLQFGVQMASDDTVDWVDQDFLDWVGDRLATQCVAARSRLADFCAERFEQDEYARWNLSYHLLQAKRYQQVLEWWATPSRLEAQRAAAQPHEERMLIDLHALVLASLELGRDEDAILWLFRAGDLAGGRDAFATILADRLDVAVAADLIGLIDGEIRGGSTGPRAGRAGSFRSSRRIWHHDATSDFRLAAALAARPDRREDAAMVYARAAARHREEEARLGEHARDLSIEAWENIVRYRVRVGALSATLNWLSHMRGAWALEIARTAANDWINGSEAQPLAVIARARLSRAVNAAAYVGALSARDSNHPAGASLRGFPKSAVKAAVLSIQRALRPNAPLRCLADQSDFRRDQVTSALVDAAEQLLAAGFVPEVRRLTDMWCPRLPRYWADWSIRDFLRWKSLKEASGGGQFDPSTYEAPTRPGGTEEEQKSETERLRKIMGAIYPALRVRADAWAGRDPGSIPDSVREALSACVVNVRSRGAAPGISPLTAASWLLEATLRLEPRQESLVEEIINAVARILQGATDASEAFLSDVLSRDQRYLAIADRLIRAEIQRCHPPAVPAFEAVGRLLDLYFAATRVDGALARGLIERARDVAGEVDSLAGDRAAALQRITEAAYQPSRTGAPDASTLDRLCGLLTYWCGIDPKSVSPGWALQLLAGRDLPAAVDRAWALDEANLYHIFDGTTAIAAGSLRAGIVTAADVWPLIAIERDSPRWIELAKDVISELARTQNPALGPAFSLVAAATRRQIAKEDPGRARRLRDFLTWSESVGLSSTFEVARIGAILKAVEAKQTAEEIPSVKFLSHAAPHEESPTFLRESSELLSSRPRDALMRLYNASAAELSAANGRELFTLVIRLRDSLPPGDRSLLAEVVERCGGSTNVFREKAIETLNALLLNSSGQPVAISPEIASAIRDSIARLMDPGTLAYAASEYWETLGKAVFEGGWADARERRRVLLRRAALHLEHLDASSIFRLSARIGELLEEPALIRVAGAMIQETFDKAPINYEPATFGRDPRQAIPHLLALLLSHPRMDIRWPALYCVVHGLCDVEEALAPQDTRAAATDATRNLLEKLLAEFEDKSHLRWAAMREWLSFAFEHVARRTPWVLSPFARSLLPHALSRDFPHVKIREHLRNALLALQTAGATALKRGTLRALKAINRPLGRADKQAQVTVNWQHSGDQTDAFEVSPHDWDTVHYWYDNMLEGFAGDGNYLKTGALAATRYWASRLGVTESMVRDEIRGTRSRYRWEETGNSHGSEPRVELLDKYVARHALFLIAGTLVDQIPTAKGTYDDDHRWNDFLRYRVRGADPELTGRWVDAPPPAPDNYEIFSMPAQEWQQTRPVEDFSAELTSGVSEGWIVLVGNRSLSAWDRSFTSQVDCALVDSRTATSLVRVLEAPDSRRYAALPFWDVHYDCLVTEAEEECRRFESKLAHVERADRFEPNANNGNERGCRSRFYLLPAQIAFHQELPLQENDPLRYSLRGAYSLPAPEIAAPLSWTRAFGRSEWCDAKGVSVARYETWSNEHNKRWSYGHRLVVRTDALEKVLRAIADRGWAPDLIWSVRVSRNVLSGGGRIGDIDLGTTRAFLWSRIPKHLASRRGDIVAADSIPEQEARPQS